MKLPETNEERWDVLQAEIIQILRDSRLPQSLGHSEGTLSWVKQFNPDADLAMKIAAMCHDLDGCKKEWMVKKEDFSDDRSFKIAHAQKSSEIARGYLEDYGFDSEVIDRIVHLISNHEYGIDEDTNTLMRAEVFSFFEYNLPLYFKEKKYEGERVERKIHEMYSKLSPGDQVTIKIIVTMYRRDLSDYSDLTDDDWEGLHKLLNQYFS